MLRVKKWCCYDRSHSEFANCSNNVSFYFLVQDQPESTCCFWLSLSLFPFHVEQSLSLFCIFLDLGSVQISHCLFTHVSSLLGASHSCWQETHRNEAGIFSVHLTGVSQCQPFHDMDPQSYIWSRWYLPGFISLSVLIGLLWEIHWYLIPHGTSTPP